MRAVAATKALTTGVPAAGSFDSGEPAAVGAPTAEAGDPVARLRTLLADVVTLWMRTKGSHWHISGPHFRDYHRLLDEQANELAEMIDPLAERARKLGGPTLRSIDDVLSHRRLGGDPVATRAAAMLAELRTENERLVRFLRDTHGACAERGDVGTTSLLEAWIDETEGRIWFLAEIGDDERRG